jgi:hypothetical protein
VSAKRWLARSPRAARAVAEEAFLMFCASSSATTDHSTLDNTSTSAAGKTASFAIIAREDRLPARRFRSRFDMRDMKCDQTVGSMEAMSRIVLGVQLGLGCAALACLVMIPMKFPSRDDKRRAILGAFLNRFVLGFVVANVVLPLPGAVAGAVLGLAVSAPDAVITKAYGPIIGMGTAMGALCGWIVATVVP